jgi:hypothetical protein
MDFLTDIPTDLGFILLRNVRDKETGEYWKLSYNCIRKFYPKNYIIIIDDNSDYDYIDLDFQKNKLLNAHVIRSEYPKRGEILPYYYYLENRLFNTAFIIHDSVFINSYLDTEITDYRFLLEFKCETREYEKEELEMINVLNNKDVLLNVYKKRHLWKGCFGVMTIISYDFLKEIDTKYNIFSLFPLIKTRRARICFEIVFACILQSCSQNKSLLGDIKYYCKWGIKFNEFKKDIFNLDKIKLPLIKVWTGR